MPALHSIEGTSALGSQQVIKRNLRCGYKSDSIGKTAFIIGKVGLT